MTKLDKDDILNRLLEAATVRWGGKVVEEMRPGLEIAADAIWEVEQHQLEADEEPVLLTMLLQQERPRKVRVE